MIKTCVLIPSYNEAKTIGLIIKEIKDKGLAVVVIDDGSTDETSSVARALGAVVLRHDRNAGKGTSLREGFSYALKGDYDAILIMDGDGQHKTSDIDSLFKKMDDSGADIVIGNRMSDTALMPLDRKITNRIMSYIISRMCGQDIPDTQCGFKLIKRTVLENLKLESSNFEIESEIVLKANKAHFKIASAPIKTVYMGGRSNINPVFDTLRFLAFLAKAAFK